MKLGVFSIFDSKAKSYLQPFYAMNAAVACRQIEDTVADPQHPFHRHAGDYTLFQTAVFDPETGSTSDLEAKTNLGVLTQFLPADNVVPMKGVN